jgi:hypothetical protein
MVSRATSAAKAVSGVAYIGTTQSLALPAKNSKRVFRFGKGSAENARDPGKGAASAVRQSLRNRYGIRGRHDREGHGFSRATKGATMAGL